jgi:Tol biopolymer transport system component
VQLTFFQEFGVGSPRWSPDGQWITFDRRATQQADIYVMREDGSGLQQLTFHSLADTMPSWSPDGEWIYFTSFRRGKNQIWKVPRTGGEPLQVTQGEANESLASADGQSLYFTNTNKKLLHLDLETGKEAPVPGLEEVEIGRYWDLTTNAIYFVSDRDKNLLRDDRQPVIYRFDLASRKISPITTIEGILPEWLPGLSVTPDERMIAVSYLTTIFGDIQLIENR